MRRKFIDDGLLEWEAYVSGGQPDSAAAARIYFVCLTDPYERPRWVRHESGDVAEAHRELRRLDDARLQEMLSEATPLD